MTRQFAQSPTQGVQKGGQGRRKQAGSASHFTESQQVMALAPLFKKRKTDGKEIDEFQAKVTANQKALGAALEQRLRRAKDQDSRRRNELESALLKAMQTPNRPLQGGTPNLGNSKIAKNYIYSSTAGVIRDCVSLINEYDRLDMLVAAMHDEAPTEISETWKEKIEETSSNLKMGARTALRNVQRVLGAAVQDAPDGTGEVDVDADADLDGDGDRETEEPNYELQKSLKYVERGVKRMAKGLGEEDL